MRELEKSLRELDLEDRALPHTRRALRETRATLETLPYGSIAIALFVMWLVLKLFKVPFMILRDVSAYFEISLLNRGAEHVLWVFRPGASDVPMRSQDAPILFLVMVMAFVVPFWWLFDRRPARGASYRHRTTIRVQRALRVCADAYSQESGHRSAQLREVDRAMRDAQNAILRAHRYSRTIWWRSTRRAAARNHAALVAGALQEELLQIDIEPDVALPRLGAKLAMIGERCAEGRIGAMLPEDVLVKATPVSAARNALRESLHVAFVILMAMVASVGASEILPGTGVSDEMRPWLIVGAAVLAAILVGGWHRVGRILEIFPGK
ncbi:hypothetical protein ACF1BK_06185 [Streptomyces globisporus]|uniref:hypothetical protein n=1 Tax=Streptomyces globisporus TaxID=1908 RepID=UPI0036FC5072